VFEQICLRALRPVNAAGASDMSTGVRGAVL
jgi:hypothetical protein